ncbi:MAG: hypothetical protein A2X05_18735 [Bacteroidetes bacterium GWE2_41_25]|nr:MAG: hypothetical protein A2X03_12145 [Bacteroidetes bacterium GWA2_40_15]OFX93658.1 MAG: hypothetical protein A2X06_05640 [Bacteroidetes bacterium GWC2_40_22]OFY01614.1 MAG: hypothetical protein A2X05_18735 [Bacteroidetes bacterium GWE2_41_25]OFY61093.1 MAG: hypothetical protein A2X04_00550 [Bacteroidetes bacterium GWF2_41_9]HAM10863.1 hypothetical protein [Bacteroidales bacterium]
MKALITSIALLVSVYTFSQVHDPVKWNTTVTALSPDNALITIRASIEENWHIYSQTQNIKNGPKATSFKFLPNNSFEIAGSVKEEQPIQKREAAYDNMIVSYFEKNASFRQKIAIRGNEKFKLNFEITYMACSEEMCLPPETKEFSVDVMAASGKEKIGSLKQDFIPSGNILTGWAIFLAGFIGGLLALLTPCVFPMLPLTVSYFTKQSKTKAIGIRNALIYAISIIVIYVALGLVITLTLGPDALNALASNGIMNLAFFFIFVVFAVSFFGAFEITLPGKWLNAPDRASDRGGLIGIFFMAFTLSLVSFSCTGPIIGSLLVQAAVNGDVTGPAIGMFGFALALALPFALFAAFPGWLNSLPKSGGWLNSVKVVLGFVELALALKFLSSVDLAYHWGILTREVFIALWIVIFSLLGFYLLGKLRLPHDSEQKHTSISGLLSSILVFGFVVYLIPGMWGAPLKMISGFPPPAFYTEGWNLQSRPENANSNSASIISDNESHCPHNLNCFHNYDEGIAFARKENKPVILDFTGWSCVNCRKMEDNVWSDKTVLGLLNNNYVLISLYVDDKTPLPESEQYVSETTGKKIKTIGNKWSDFQTTHFKTNSQPYYVLTDHDGKLLTTPKGYDSSIEDYVNFLNGGISNFRKI